MERTGSEAQMRVRSAFVPSLPYGNGVVCCTHLQTSSPASFPRTGRVRLLRSRFHLQFSVLQPKVSKFGVLGIAKHPVLPRCSRQELSTADKVGEKESSRHLYELRDSQVADHDLLNSADKEDSSFNWLAQWYPVGVLKHMDKRQPHPVTILGRDLVMWWDQSGGEWQVFADVCPHRQAPLSEGRINEQGHLQCSYHGWAFAPSSGVCTLIPQAPQDRLEVKDSKRACAKVYQSKHHQGLLFVYMDTSEGAKERAAANPPPFLPILSDPDFVYDMVMADLSYSYESLMENLVDPAHVPIAHHKLQGNRNSAKPLDFHVDNISKAGFSGSNPGRRARFEYVAPYLSVLEFNLPASREPKGHPWALKVREFILSKRSGGESLKKKKIATVVYCIPTVPGKSKLFFAFPRNFAQIVHHWTPAWWRHQLHMTVLDSDMYLLHLMERRLEDGGGMANIENLYYTPTASDAFVIAYRRWLKKFGGSVPDFGPKATDRLPPSALKTVLLDRRSSHVDNCTYCSGALRNIKAIESVLHVLPFILLGLVAILNGRPLLSVSSLSVPLICIAVVSTLALRWLSHWRRKNFEFHDYNHAFVK